MTTPQSGQAPNGRSISSGLTLLLACACGLIVANIYYAQPLAGPISAELGMSPAAAGLIVTLSQLGYGLGLLLVVPMGDLIENRRLIVTLITAAAIALVLAAVASNASVFLFSALLIGISSVAVQVLMPYAAHMAPDAERGRVIGNVGSGLMLGIMLARPVASFITQASSWHFVFVGSALLMATLAVVMWRALPPRTPTSALSYGALLWSMAKLMSTTTVLRRRAFYQAFLFSAFSIFWTTTPLLLAGPAFGLSQGGIALFALAGVAGAIAAPIAGRLADRGFSRPATAIGMLCVVLAFGLTHLVPLGSPYSLALLVTAAILLDFGVSANTTLSQRAIFALGAESRSRMNGVYMTTFFFAGAIGSAVGAFAFVRGGWLAASAIGALLPLCALLYFASE